MEFFPPEPGKSMSRLRALGVLHQRCRRQLSPCPLIGPQPISPSNVSAQGNSPGCPCRCPFRSCRTGGPFLWPFLCVESPQGRPVWEGDSSRTMEQRCVNTGRCLYLSDACAFVAHARAHSHMHTHGTCAGIHTHVSMPTPAGSSTGELLWAFRLAPR